MSFTSIGSSGARRRIVLIGATLAMAVMGCAGAARIPQIIHARQSHFHALGRITKSLRDQIGRSRPDWRVVASDANRIERLASALPKWFPAGSGKRRGVKTRARAAIWAHPRAFNRAARALLDRAHGLTQAAAGHDLRALRLRIRSLGQACDSCHRRFRAHSSWW